MSSSGSSSNAYKFKPGGSLKFKGEESTKKKKSSSKGKSKSSLTKETHDATLASSSSRSEKRLLGSEELDPADGEVRRLALQDEDLRDQAAEAKSSHSSERKKERAMTEAERKFQEVRLKRMRERVAKEARKSHKEKVDDFNKYLEGESLGKKSAGRSLLERGTRHCNVSSEPCHAKLAYVHTKGL